MEIGVRRQLVSREPQKQYAVPRVNSKCRELSPKTEEGIWRVVLREMTRGSLADVETLEQTSEVENGGGVVPRAEVGMTDTEWEGLYGRGGWGGPRQGDVKCGGGYYLGPCFLNLFSTIYWKKYTCLCMHTHTQTSTYSNRKFHEATLVFLTCLVFFSSLLFCSIVLSFV